MQARLARGGKMDRSTREQKVKVRWEEEREGSEKKKEGMVKYYRYLGYQV